MADGFTQQRVTGLFKRHVSSVVELTFEGLDEPIKATPNHPFWSVDRAQWVAAGELLIYEQVATLSGTATLVSHDTHHSDFQVFNLEIDHTHNYLVSNQGLVVHNNCGDGAAKLFRETLSAPSKGQLLFNKRLADIKEAMQDIYRFGSSNEIPGGLVGAIRHEIATGIKVKGADHIKKGRDAIK
ncbi:MAG: hypothetical protein KDC35_02765 [Acidobacteria bacterium]|nr:hypothetical protein [Acidobacteriota bacterium]